MPETAATLQQKIPAAGRGQAWIVLLFSFALFLSAAAMFMMQPMMGKMLLPRIGGTPAGWITAVAFFQLMLLLGYLFAHGMVRFSPRSHGLGYLALLIIGATVLPLSLPTDINAAHINAGGVFMLLLASAGLPFIALSATAATLQRLFLTTGHAQASDPYFLYAASNLGSFAGLLLYPVAVEPFTTLDTQAEAWFYAYGLLGICAAGCLIAGMKKTQAQIETAQTMPAGKDMLRWGWLAFIPSALLLAVTTHIVTDIISAPLIWVLPLAAYLLTFVMAFSRRQIIPAVFLQKITPAVIAFAFAHTLMMGGYLSKSIAIMALHLFSFSVIALYCHQRLATARPPASHLTAFYLMIALGGALGGALNAFAAPMLLNTLAEYPVLLMAAALAAWPFRGAFTGKKIRIAFFMICATAVVLLFMVKDPFATSTTIMLLLAMASFALSYPRGLVVLALVFFAVGKGFYKQEDVILSERNFFGVLRVVETTTQDSAGNDYRLRKFMHGTTLHGFQVVDPATLSTIPTSYYYSPTSPLNEALVLLAPKDVAVVGLGAGTLACHSAPDRRFSFFEIDPAVIRIAQNNFTFLSECPGAAPHRLIEGDGRLALAAEQTALYDLIILDAFSSDTIPPHLITEEAVRIYLSRLNAGGVIVFNISSRYFNMMPVLTAAADAAGLTTIYKKNTPGKAHAPMAQASSWLLMGPNATALEPLIQQRGWMRGEAGGALPWHDNYSNILGVLE